MGIPIRLAEAGGKAKSRGSLKSSNYVQVRCSDQHGEELQIRIKAHCPFQLLSQVYREKILYEQNSLLTFWYRGKRLKPDQTPEDVGMSVGEENFIWIVDVPV